MFPFLAQCEGCWVHSLGMRGSYKLKVGTRIENRNKHSGMQEGEDVSIPSRQAWWKAGEGGRRRSFFLWPFSLLILFSLSSLACFFSSSVVSLSSLAIFSSSLTSILPVYKHILQLPLASPIASPSCCFHSVPSLPFQFHNQDQQEHKLGVVVRSKDHHFFQSPDSVAGLAIDTFIGH